MNAILALATLALTSTTTFAQGTISCKKLNEAKSHGYEVVASQNQAVLLIKGSKSC